MQSSKISLWERRIFSVYFQTKSKQKVIRLGISSKFDLKEISSLSSELYHSILQNLILKSNLL